jgi:hypothetical protein
MLIVMFWDLKNGAENLLTGKKSYLAFACPEIETFLSLES